MPKKSILELLNKRDAPEVVLKDFLGSKNDSARAGHELAAHATDYGLSLETYLNAAIEPRKTKDPRFKDVWPKEKDCPTGFEAALSYLNLPIKENLALGVSLEAAAETFQTYPGSRVLFPEVLNKTLLWSTRIDQIETLGSILAQSREIDGVEQITTIMDDTEETSRIAAVIGEGSRIPIKSVKSSEQNVRMFKVGMGWTLTYEFQRRVRLDVLTPYAARAYREAARAKMSHAVNILVNGDGVNSAATTVTQASYNTLSGSTSSAKQIDWPNFMAWVVARAQAGVPIDTVVGNWGAYYQWMKMFSQPTVNAGEAASDILSKAGQKLTMPMLINTPIKFALASTMADYTLLGMRQAETLEELRETGSDISESERLIDVQKIMYTHTENVGYNLIMGDTRSVYDYTDAGSSS